MIECFYQHLSTLSTLNPTFMHILPTFYEHWLSTDKLSTF